MIEEETYTNTPKEQRIPYCYETINVDSNFVLKTFLSHCCFKTGTKMFYYDIDEILFSDFTRESKQALFER